MFARLIQSLACNFSKTKWTHPIPKRNPNKKLQLPFKTWKIFTGDTVMIRAGDDKGKTGRVVRVLRKMNKIVVRGINKRWYTKSSDRLM